MDGFQERQLKNDEVNRWKITCTNSQFSKNSLGSNYIKEHPIK